jgi:hypothetical protein
MFNLLYAHGYQETNCFYPKKIADLHVQFTKIFLKIQFTAGNPDFNLLFLFTSVILYYLVIYLFYYFCYSIYLDIYLFVQKWNFSLVSQVPRQVCKDVAREECAQVPREITTYKTEQECSTHTQKQCKPAQKTVCDETVTTR